MAGMGSRLYYKVLAVDETAALARKESAHEETEYWHRTDTFEEKLALLKAASERRDFRLARGLESKVEELSKRQQ